MNVLDENIPEHQRQLLRSWRIRTHLIGADFSRKGIQDEQIIPLLHSLKRPTFFTRDQGFYRRDLCHAGYCLVCLEVNRSEVALFVSGPENGHSPSVVQRRHLFLAIAQPARVSFALGDRVMSARPTLNS